MMTAVVFGIVAPVLVAGGSWLLAERTWRRDPKRLTAVMIAAFAGKIVFFGVYVAFMLSVLSLPPTPFAASLTASFIACHLAEAFALKRLFQSSPQ